MRLVEHAKQIQWGTFGRGALEELELFGTPLPPMRIKTLGECDTDHLHAIRAHVKPETHGEEGFFVLQMAIHLILEDRAL